MKRIERRKLCKEIRGTIKTREEKLAGRGRSDRYQPPIYLEPPTQKVHHST